MAAAASGSKSTTAVVDNVQEEDQEVSAFSPISKLEVKSMKIHVYKNFTIK
jgi:hypothetical protein